MDDLKLLYLYLEDLGMSYRAKDYESIKCLLSSNNLNYFLNFLKEILEKGEKNDK